MSSKKNAGRSKLYILLNIAGLGLAPNQNRGPTILWSGRFSQGLNYNIDCLYIFWEQPLPEISAIYQKYTPFTRNNGHLSEITSFFQNNQSFTRINIHLPETPAIYQN